MEKCLHFSMTFLLILHAANAATEMERQRNRGELRMEAEKERREDFHRKYQECLTEKSG